MFAFTISESNQARIIHLNIWSSGDDQDSKTGRPQTFVVVLKYITFAEQLGSRKMGKIKSIIKRKLSKIQ